MFHYMFTVSYDGSSFNGWQLQPDNPLITIQGLLNYELSKLQVKILISVQADVPIRAYMPPARPLIFSAIKTLI